MSFAGDIPSALANAMRLVNDGRLIDFSMCLIEIVDKATCAASSACVSPSLRRAARRFVANQLPTSSSSHCIDDQY